MKNWMMLLLVCLGWQMQAQETLCDFTYTVGTQEEFEVAIPTTGKLFALDGSIVCCYVCRCLHDGGQLF